MIFYSTNNHSVTTSFKEATLNGLAPDKGLYFPSHIPQLPLVFFKNINSYGKTEIALKVMQPYVGDEIPINVLTKILEATVAMEFPLVPINDRIAALELFHGPTLAFKDVGARFMSRCLSYFVQDKKQKVTVLVATSGDTGGAVAHGFYDVAGIEVVILYPSGKVSDLQEKQLTSLGKNITALEVDGNFDDCQHMIKKAFTDASLNKEVLLTSANSINVARWLPQQLYYFFAFQQLEHKELPFIISVPSGNFGNICAGLLAYKSGLPVHHFIAACNANDTIPLYFETGNYTPKSAVTTISNAMDVGEPSNFVRILELFDHDFAALKKVVSSVTITDEETKNTIRKVYQESSYLLDPHGAVAYVALKQYLERHSNQKGIFLETAHPIKFNEFIQSLIMEQITEPKGVQHLSGKEKHSIKIKADYNLLKQYLLDTK